MLKLVIAAIASAGLAFGAVQAQPITASLVDGNEIVLLGTRGGPSADPARSEPANLLVVSGRPYLIDAGEGAARQLAAAGEPVTSVRTIFITHHHLDHTAGLEPLIALTFAIRA